MANNSQPYQVPSGTELVGVGERFVAKEGDRWFIMQNYDYEDRQGNMGCSTEILGSPHGYETEDAAERALAGRAA